MTDAPDARMPVGMIDLDSDFGRSIGFTSDLFKDGSFLFGDENGILWISMVLAKHKGAGDFRSMMQNIESMGITFRIPTPIGNMVRICMKQGWMLKSAYDPDAGEHIFYFTNEGKK